MKKILKSLSPKEKTIGALLVATIFIVGIHGLFSLRTPVEPEAADGGRYTEGLVGEIIALNPLFTDFNEVDADISRLIFSGLTKYDPETRNFQPDLATYTISEDQKTYTFTLKENILWHDGEALTADDVVFTFQGIIQNPNFRNPILRAPFQGVEIKKIDKRTISFTLNQPNSFFISNTLTGIVPKHVLEKVPIEALDQAPFNFQPIGSGPYMVDGPPRIGNDERMQVSVSVFKKYYGEKPRIKEIRFFTYPTKEVLIKESSALNGIPKVLGNMYDAIEENEADRLKLVPYKLPQYEVIILNTEGQLTKQKAVRTALAKSINKKELVSLLEHKAIVDTPFLELDQSSWIHQTNLEDARRILNENGWTKEDDEPYRTAGEILLELNIIVPEHKEGSSKAQETKKIVNYLVSQWAKIGVKVKAEYLDEANFGDRMQHREYDLILTGHNLGYNLDTYSFWHSSQSSKGGLNLSNYRSFQADSLLEDIRNSFYSKEKQEQLQQLEKIISNDVPAIFLYTPIYYFATDETVKNFNVNNFAFTQDRFANVARWYIKER